MFAALLAVFAALQNKEQDTQQSKVCRAGLPRNPYGWAQGEKWAQGERAAIACGLSRGRVRVPGRAELRAPIRVRLDARRRQLTVAGGRTQVPPLPPWQE